ncbi:hypothetical protein BHE74_00042955, partial [Ensete ventricosum]
HGVLPCAILLPCEYCCLSLGCTLLQYVLCGPLVAMAAGEWRDGRAGGWWLHLLLLFVLRSLTYQLWFSFANMLFLTRTRRVIKDGVDFKQIDSEWDWDNFLILQALLGSVVLCRAPSLEEMPLLQLKGCVIALVLHVVVSEPLFYMAHRCFHRGYLFTHYHSIHHSSPVPQPITGTYTKHLLLSSHGHLMNQLMPGGVGHWTSRVWHAIGAPRPECGDGGAAAGGVRYGAWLSEPGVWLRPRLRLPAVHGIQQRGGVAFQALRRPTRPQIHSLLPYVSHVVRPLVEAIVCVTVQYLSLHHKEKNCNFCLFMPLFDFLGKTANNKSWDLQKEISSGAFVHQSSQLDLHYRHGS